MKHKMHDVPENNKLKKMILTYIQMELSFLIFTTHET